LTLNLELLALIAPWARFLGFATFNIVPSSSSFKITFQL